MTRSIRRRSWCALACGLALALPVFLVTRLLPDHHNLRAGRTFAGYDLRRILVERAAGASGLRGTQGLVRGDADDGIGEIHRRINKAAESGVPAQTAVLKR